MLKIKKIVKYSNAVGLYLTFPTIFFCFSVGMFFFSFFLFLMHGKVYNVHVNALKNQLAQKYCFLNSVG